MSEPRPKRNKKAEALLARWEAVASLVNKPVRVEFDKHNFTSVLEYVDKARLADLVNIPDQREVDPGLGKLATPAIITVKLVDGPLHFVDDDVTDIIIGVSGVSIKMNDVVVKLCPV